MRNPSERVKCPICESGEIVPDPATMNLVCTACPVKFSAATIANNFGDWKRIKRGPEATAWLESLLYKQLDG